MIPKMPFLWEKWNNRSAGTGCSEHLQSSAASFVSGCLCNLFQSFWDKQGGSVPVCCQTLQVLIWKTEHVFVWVPCGFLQLCIPAGTVEGGRVLQRYFSHCQGAHRSAGILLNSKLPLIRWVFKEKPGGHVGNTLGSRIIPLLVPVNKNIAKIRTGDMAVD